MSTIDDNSTALTVANGLLRPVGRASADQLARIAQVVRDEHDNGTRPLTSEVYEKLIAALKEYDRRRKFDPLRQPLGCSTFRG